jgi:hypothetical protein
MATPDVNLGFGGGPPMIPGNQPGLLEQLGYTTSGMESNTGGYLEQPASLRGQDVDTTEDEVSTMVSFNLQSKAMPGRNDIFKYENVPLFVLSSDAPERIRNPKLQKVFSLYDLNSVLRQKAADASNTTQTHGRKRNADAISLNKHDDSEAYREDWLSVGGVAKMVRYAGYQISALRQDPDMHPRRFTSSYRTFGCQAQGEIDNVPNVWGQVKPGDTLCFAIKMVAAHETTYNKASKGDEGTWFRPAPDNSARSGVTEYVQIVPIVTDGTRVPYGHSDKDKFRCNSFETRKVIEIDDNGEQKTITGLMTTPAHIFPVGTVARITQVPSEIEAINARWNYTDYCALARDHSQIDIHLFSPRLKRELWLSL